MTQVARRHVVYIAGFDPVPPRAYRERYRREAARQAALCGYSITQAPTPDGLRHGWAVTARIEGASTRTVIELLYWADIVQAGMKGGIVASYLALLRVAWAYIGSGALIGLLRLRKGPAIAALYPVALLVGQLALAGLAGHLAGLALARGVGLMQPPGPGWQGLPGWLAYLAGLAATVWLLLRWCQRRDHLYAWYLMRVFAFSAGHGGAYPPAQERRMAAFADRIAALLASDVDEVLIIGHSLGAHIAVSVLADLLRGGRVASHGPGGGPGRGPALSLLTLGHVMPMVSFLPDAGRLRADLALLAGAACITWVDVTAPGDGCCFALCDPVAVSGVAPAGARWPLVISAAFRQTLRPQTRRALRWRLFETHFQYLNAFDNLPGRVDDYDYFRITAGPLSLGARFAGRAASPGRIVTPMNRHRGLERGCGP